MDGTQLVIQQAVSIIVEADSPSLKVKTTLLDKYLSFNFIYGKEARKCRLHGYLCRSAFCESSLALVLPD